MTWRKALCSFEQNELDNNVEKVLQLFLFELNVISDIFVIWVYYDYVLFPSGFESICIYNRWLDSWSVC